MKKMIGYYNYSVVVTYAGLISAIIGIMHVFNENYKAAMLCLIFSGVCDMFDGNIARMMKNRTDQEKVFGIQIDSLSDLICFGIFPALFGYSIFENKLFGGIVSVLLVLAAVIRLAYFNVKEQERQQETAEKRKYYQGLPVTSMSMVLPSIYCLRNVLGKVVYSYVLLGSYIIISFLFLYDFKFLKPGKRASIIMAIYGVLLLIGVLFI